MANRELVALIEGTPQLIAPTASDTGTLAGGLTAAGTIATSNVAGPAVLNEVPSDTNPTLIPNRTELTTGIGWSPNEIVFIGGGARFAFIQSAGFKTNNTAGPALLNESATATNPTLAPHRGDVDTGLGRVSADVLSLIAGGVSQARATTTTFEIAGLLLSSSTDSITCGTTQTQAGATALTTDINRITVCANIADVVGLPSAIVGASCKIIHDGAQNAGVFPKISGNNIDGEAANAVDSNALVAGTTRVYNCVTAGTWETAS